MQIKIFKYKKVTSTNDIAMKLIREKKKESGFVYAETQTKGRGTKGRRWISEMDNFFGTIFFQLKENYPPFNEFSIINPVIISEIIYNFCNDCKISFKWPNDILLNNKKVCGILQEVITLNNKTFLLIGVGINTISNPEIYKDYDATNILKETKKKPPIGKIINMLIEAYEKFFIQLKSYSFIKYKTKVKIMSTN